MASRCAGSANAAKAANSLRRPSRTCASSGASKSVKNRTARGCPRAHHEEQRIDGASAASASRAQRPLVDEHAQALAEGRLPTWSWFSRTRRNAVGASAPLGSPRARPLRVASPWKRTFAEHARKLAAGSSAKSP